MKGPLFQLLASGITLGIMAGAVTIHSLHVSGAKSLGIDEGVTPVAGAPLGGAMMVGLDAGPGPPVAGGTGESHEDRLVRVALEKLVGRLEEMNDENRDLRRQVEEINQDFNGMQFQLDSYSSKFRPLPLSSSGSLLEGSISPGSQYHSLLPPKGP